MVPHLGVPVDFRSILARNGSGMNENQHNLVKTARNFDASPAVTTGRPQDPILGRSGVETARSAAMWSAKVSWGVPHMPCLQR